MIILSCLLKVLKVNNFNRGEFLNFKLGVWFLISNIAPRSENRKKRNSKFKKQSELRKCRNNDQSMSNETSTK